MTRTDANEVAEPGLVVAMLPWPDRFEDFHDKVGISLEDFRERLSGTWLFSYLQALRSGGVRPVLYIFSARVRGPKRFTHVSTGVPVRVLPSPWLHRKMQGARDRFDIRSRMYGSALSYVATPWIRLARELRRDGCAAILCQEYEYARFDGAVVIGRMLGLPVFATFQGGDRTWSALERPLRKLTIRRAAGLIAGSRAEVDRVRHAYGVAPERIAWIPNAVDVRRWTAVDQRAARDGLEIPPDVPVVVWHGRVEVHSKGLDVLVDAWRTVCEMRRERLPLLLLVGSAQDHEAFGRSLANLPTGSVRWDDRFVLDRDLLKRNLSAADVAVRPSRNEGFSIALVEAMACGLPIVAADASGVVDALGDGVGIVVPRDDASALAEGIIRLLDDETLRRALGERARRRARESFSVEVVGAQLRAFMEERGLARP
jgi:glycosyltransferase involved in cell wall biosynthesis